MSKSSDDNNGKLVGRRSLLTGGATLLGGLVAAGAIASSSQASAAPAKPGKPVKAGDGDANRLTIAIAGESMVYRPFSQRTDPQFLALVDMLRAADVAYTHLETNLADNTELKWSSHGSTGPAGYLVSAPVIAKDMAWAGIDVMSLAQNHAYDWGADGMLATLKHCQEAGITVAGTGADLETARAPAFFETAKGRMALVSTASGNSANEWAGFGKGEIPGRPGVNPLRLRTIYEVPADAAAQLKGIGEKLVVYKAATGGDFNITPGAVSGSNGFSGFAFRPGTDYAIHTESHPGDVTGNLRSIDEARNMSDFVMVAHHNSTSEGTRSTTPSEFVVDFAHKAIDGGADMYIGHGWHTFLGIEIYKGKPIFYGLGSFFVESQFMPRVPADQFESYNYDMDQLTTLNAGSGNLHPGTKFADWEWAPFYKLIYESGKLTQIELYPVEMGYDFSVEPPKMIRTVGEGQSKYLDGSPRLATGANAAAILAKIQKLNGLRGTQMQISGEVGIITVT